jgi:RecA-family ATPase
MNIKKKKVIYLYMKKKLVNELEYYDYQSIQNIPQVTWIIQDIIPNNGLIIVYGSPGCGKTFVVLDMCMHIINNKKWFGNNINNSGIIAYLIGEGIYGIKNRLDAWLDYTKIKTNNLIFFIPISGMHIWETENIDRLKETLYKFTKETKNKISMIVIDTLARAATGLDENSSRDMGKFLMHFEQLKDIFKCSILFIHHRGKDESKGMRGSSSLLGAVDTCIDIQKTNENIITISIEKQKDGENKKINTRLVKHNNSLVLCTKEKLIEYKNNNIHDCFSVGSITLGS